MGRSLDAGTRRWRRRKRPRQEARSATNQLRRRGSETKLFFRVLPLILPFFIQPISIAISVAQRKQREDEAEAKTLLLGVQFWQLAFHLARRHPSQGETGARPAHASCAKNQAGEILSAAAATSAATGSDDGRKHSTASEKAHWPVLVVRTELARRGRQGKAGAAGPSVAGCEAGAAGFHLFLIEKSLPTLGSPSAGSAIGQRQHD